MDKYGVIVDSTISIPTSLLADNFLVVNHHIIFSEETYEDEAYPQKIEFGHLSVAKTSQPNPYQFLSAIRDHVNNGYNRIIIVTLTKETSGTFNSAMQSIGLAQGYDDVASAKILLIDSMQVALGHGLVLNNALKKKKLRSSYDLFTEYLLKSYNAVKSYYLIANVLPMLKAKRLQGSFYYSDMLNLWYLVEVRGGKLFIVERYRAKNKGISALMEKMIKGKSSNYRYIVNQVGMPQEADLILNKIISDGGDVNSSPLSLALSVHFGPYAIGISRIKKWS